MDRIEIIRGICASLLLGIFLPYTAHSSELFRKFFLPCAEKIESVQMQDLNGDQLKDIALFYLDKKSSQRRFALFIQKQDGFTEKADQIFSIPENATIIDFGDIAQSPGLEFVYFTPAHIVYHTLTDSGFNKQPSVFHKNESIFLYPDKQKIQLWDFVRDYNGDGLDDVFEPKFSGTNLYLAQKKSPRWRKTEIQLLPVSRPYAYFDSRFSVGSRAGAVITMPYLLLEDFDADGCDDLIAIEKKVLLVHRLHPDGTFSKIADDSISIDHGDIWSGAKIMRTHLDDEDERHFLMRVIDIDKDGLLDIVSAYISTQNSLINPETSTKIYCGKKTTEGRFYFSQTPDYYIEPDGTQMVIDIFDFNHDGRMDFLIPTIKIGVTSIIKMLLTRSVNFEAQLFLMHSDAGYSAKAEKTIEMNVKFSFRGGAASPIYEVADLTGDGQLDILTSVDEEKLLIYRGDAEKIFRKNTKDTYRISLPQDGTLVKTEDLNNDKHADVIIRYEEEKLKWLGKKGGLTVLLNQMDKGK